MRRMKKQVPGILLAVVLAASARWLAGFCPGINAVCLAILIGMIWGNVAGHYQVTQAGLAFTEKRILPVAIALMGLELNLKSLSELGPTALLIILPAMVFGIFSAMLFGRLLKVPVRNSLLIGIGSSVCGSSAILAAAPALESEKDECALAVAAVNLIGTVGLFILPVLARLLDLSDMQSAYLLGGSLQAVGQVVASGLSLSDSIGHQALVVKMLRVLMIGPIVLTLIRIFHSGKGGARKRGLVPGYIIGFAACSLLGTFLTGDRVVLPHLCSLGSGLLTVAMVAIGSKIQFQSLWKQGGKTLAVSIGSGLVLTATVLFLLFWLV